MNVKVIALGASLLGLAVGGAGGYLAGKQRFKKKYEELAQQEIDEAKAFYDVLHKKGELSTPEGVVEKTQRRVPGATIPKDLNPEEEERINKEYDQVGLKFLEGVRAARGYGKPEQEEGNIVPHICPVNVFMENDENWTQDTLIYYGDGVVANSDMEPVDNLERMIGSANLVFDGELSDGDTNTVYIRNPAMQAYYEICKDSRMYAEMIGMS